MARRIKNFQYVKKETKSADERKQERLAKIGRSRDDIIVRADEKKSSSSGYQEQGLLRKAGTPESSLRPSVAQDIQQGNLRSESGFEVVNGQLATGNAARALAIQQEQEYQNRRSAGISQVQNELRQDFNGIDLSETRRRLSSRVVDEARNPTITIPSQPRPAVQTPRAIPEIEKQLQRLEARETASRARLDRIQNVANYATGGRGRPVEQRGFVGQYSSYLLGGVMSAPFAIGEGVAGAVDKTVFIAKNARNLNLKGLGQPFKTQKFRDTYNPLKPQGLATYTFAAVGGIAKGSQAKPVTIPKNLRTRGTVSQQYRQTYVDPATGTPLSLRQAFSTQGNVASVLRPGRSSFAVEIGRSGSTQFTRAINLRSGSSTLQLTKGSKTSVYDIQPGKIRTTTTRFYSKGPGRTVTRTLKSRPQAFDQETPIYDQGISSTRREITPESSIDLQTNAFNIRGIRQPSKAFQETVTRTRAQSTSSRQGLMTDQVIKTNILNQQRAAATSRSTPVLRQDFVFSQVLDPSGGGRAIVRKGNTQALPSTVGFGKTRTPNLDISTFNEQSLSINGITARQFNARAELSPALRQQAQVSQNVLFENIYSSRPAIIRQGSNVRSMFQSKRGSVRLVEPQRLVQIGDITKSFSNRGFQPTNLFVEFPRVRSGSIAPFRFSTQNTNLSQKGAQGTNLSQNIGLFSISDQKYFQRQNPFQRVGINQPLQISQRQFQRQTQRSSQRQAFQNQINTPFGGSFFSSPPSSPPQSPPPSPPIFPFFGGGGSLGQSSGKRQKGLKGQFTSSYKAFDLGIFSTKGFNPGSYSGTGFDLRPVVRRK